MLIKEENGQWSARINFIDKNDAFVGFDYSACCCESFGYYVAEDKTSEQPDIDLSLDGFWFDTSVQPEYVEPPEEDRYGEVDGALAFRCVNDKDEVRYLHLYNYHNGCYSHGWDSSFGGEGAL